MASEDLSTTLGPWGWVAAVFASAVPFIQWLYTKRTADKNKDRGDVIELLHAEFAELKVEYQNSRAELHSTRDQLHTCQLEKREMEVLYAAQQKQILELQAQVAELRSQLKKILKEQGG